MIYLFILFLCIAIPIIYCVIGGIVVGAVGAVLLGLFTGLLKLFGKREPLPYNHDIFPNIPEESD